MAYEFYLRDSKGNYLGDICLGQFERSYRLPSGVMIPVYDAVAWCTRCRRFVEVERLTSLEEIDAEIARVRAGDSGTRRAREKIARLLGEDCFVADPGEASRQQQLDEEELQQWQNVRAWRVERRSPPRCLRCGSIDIHRELRDETVMNPETGEILEMICKGHFSLVNHYLFTPEGLAIE